MSTKGHSLIQATGGPSATRHRGIYILERGTWKVTCRACGWQATDEVRRQTASMFRLHIQDSQVLDLTSLERVAEAQLAR
jgi:hypothetical protein